jgi:hypothetical protein
MFLGSIMVIVNVYELRSLHGEQMGLLLQVSDDLQQHDCPQQQSAYAQNEIIRPTLLVWSPRVKLMILRIMPLTQLVVNFST